MPFKSTKQHRQAQRFKAINEIVASGGASFSPIAYMPGRAMQVSTTVFGLFNDDVKQKEKTVLTIQGIIALTHLILLCVMVYNDDKCTDKSSGLCVTNLAFDLIYKSILAIDMSTAEINRDELQPHNTPPLSETFSGSNLGEGSDHAPNNSPTPTP